MSAVILFTSLCSLIWPLASISRCVTNPWDRIEVGAYCHHGTDISGTVGDVPETAFEEIAGVADGVGMAFRASVPSANSHRVVLGQRPVRRLALECGQ